MNSQTIEAIAAAVDYPLELDVMSLLTKTPYTLVTRHRETKMELNLEAFFLLASILQCCKVLYKQFGKNSHQQSYSDVDPAGYTLY